MAQDENSKPNKPAFGGDTMVDFPRQSDITCGFCGYATSTLTDPSIGSGWSCPKCRDQFAMAALTGIMSDEAAYGMMATSSAELAYRRADAMMEARKPTIQFDITMHCVNEAVMAERERCAKIVENPSDSREPDIATIAAKIRSGE